MTNDRDRIATALLALRLGVFIVMLIWTLDKFVNPGHAAAVFEKFHGLAGVGSAILIAVGSPSCCSSWPSWLAIASAYLWRRAGAARILTLSSYRQYLQPFDNLLFVAAWPMLAARFAFYLLRDLDTRLTF